MAEQLTGLGFKPRQSHVSILLGVTLQWTSILSGGGGGSGNTARHALCKGNLD